jgi:hypothetical protein
MSLDFNTHQLLTLREREQNVEVFNHQLFEYRQSGGVCVEYKNKSPCSFIISLDFKLQQA